MFMLMFIYPISFFEISANLCMYNDGDRDTRSMEYMCSRDYLNQELKELPNNIKMTP